MHRGLFVFAMAGVCATAPVDAQFPPDSVVNLKVLPEDMGVRDVIGVMRGFAIGLGVRCQYCHVGEPGAPLAEVDFPADDKPTKAKAREMLRMVQAINGDHLANLTDRSDPPGEVTCATCHHGQNKPLTLGSILVQARAEDGVDAAIEKYRELREQFYGSWTYDFTEGTINDVVQQIGRQSPDDGIRLLNLNQEFFPDSPAIHMILGQIYLIQGDSAAAITNLERSLELAPGNRNARRMLQQLRGN